MFFKKKCPVLEELQPSKAYESFKKTKERLEYLNKEELSLIERNIKRCIENGRFNTKYKIYRRYTDKRKLKELIRVIKEDGYDVFCLNIIFFPDIYLYINWKYKEK